MGYQAPLNDILNAIGAVGGFASADMDTETARAILEEAGKFASGELEPIKTIGDTHHPVLDHGRVKTHPRWASAYAAFVAAGWNSLPSPEIFGGQALPTLISMPVTEILNAANPAFALGPMLTQGAANLLSVGGSDELKNLYLPPMIEGRWTGTMCLTEAGAGTDLASLKTKAEPHPDGSYRIKGTKIFITYGDHDLTENTIHFVLARLPDAPLGVKGISLFLVPKVLVRPDGSLGERNDVVCVGLEHKLGIHGSPTCTMQFGDGEGAVGYLIGKANEGLKIMFVMMNEERLGMGLQGVGIASAAYQHALAYAGERMQGKRIIEFPDVRRMLLTMKSRTAAARMVSYLTARQIDLAHSAETPEERTGAETLAALLTPVAKAYGTDVATEVASLGIQVFGGMGFMEESGAPQFLRDARIGPIYEGTNGIQSIALAVRNVANTGGAPVSGCADMLYKVLEEVMLSDIEELKDAGRILNDALLHLEEATSFLCDNGRSGEIVLASATPYLRLFATVVGGVYLAKTALSGDPKDIALARFFAENEVVATASMLRVVKNSASVASAELL